MGTVWTGGSAGEDVAATDGASGAMDIPGVVGAMGASHGIPVVAGGIGTVA